MSQVQSQNSDTKRRRIHLHRQPRVTKGRGLVEYYSLATCFFEDGKNQKKILLGIGELTKVQAEQYRLLLKALNGETSTDNLVNLESLTFDEDYQYLGPLAMDALWRKLGIGKIFNSECRQGQKLSTENVAKILTINRLLHPSSKVRSVQWFNSTLLANIMGIDQSGYDRNKIFRELPAIHCQKSSLEKLFWEHSKSTKRKYDAYYFDGSTSWFEGSKCPLAEPDIEKTRGFFPKVLGLMLLCDNDGFPVAWEVVNGHTKDTTAIKHFVTRITQDYQIDEITYCFDRGVASEDNFALITDHDCKYISAIRDNQIKQVFDLTKFQITCRKIIDKIETKKKKSKVPLPKRRIVDIDGFISFDDNIFFKELGVAIDKKRYVASFSYELYLKKDRDREGRIKKTLLALEAKNAELKAAKGDRDYNTTERDLIELLKKNRVNTYFEYILLPLISDNKSQSFKVECKIDKQKIKDDKLTDGLLLYVTNHVEKHEGSQDFRVSASDIIRHYKGKYVVENAFRELKSFIELRPIYVWTETHVRAHYDISIIACFINNFINMSLDRSNDSLRDFHENLENAGRAAKLIAPSGLQLYKLKKITNETRFYFSRLGIKDCLSPSLHRSHGVCQ